MKRGRTILSVTCVIVLILAITPFSYAAAPEKTSKTTEKIRITVGTETLEKEVSLDTIYTIIELGKQCKEDFLIIYDKTKTIEDVKQAFQNIQPFFAALVDNSLTDKTIGELNNLYYSIRDKIRAPMREQRRAIKPQEGLQPLGIWNGIPTPIWANAICGIFDAGICIGFAAGTHALIPTIGTDAFITYGFQGESITVGLAGGTLAVTAFQVIFGFVGILIVLPLIMFGPYFMTGLCGGMVGIGA
jgi:hypothetical protein